MRQRDKDIIKSLEEFRVLDRDQIIDLHFANLKSKVNSCNLILKRLQDRGHILCKNTVKPYEYFPNPTSVHMKSTKIEHFKALANTIIEAKKFGKLREFEVEPKLGKKGTVEPDLFMIWNNAPFFVEVQTDQPQKSSYFKTKLKRYVDYYNSDDWRSLPWQRSEKQFFPYVMILSKHVYEVPDTNMKVFQVKSVEEFVRTYVKR